MSKSFVASLALSLALVACGSASAPEPAPAVDVQQDAMVEETQVEVMEKDVAPAASGAAVMEGKAMIDIDMQ